MLNLKPFDAEIDQLLIEPFAEIEIKSKALANSLKRCLDEARNSRRFEAAYKAGLEAKWANLSQEEILSNLIKPFEEEDFMHFREFVRLLRACSLHIGGQTSAKIKTAYNKTLKNERLFTAYQQGLNLL